MSQQTAKGLILERVGQVSHFFVLFWIWSMYEHIRNGRKIVAWFVFDKNLVFYNQRKKKKYFQCENNASFEVQSGWKEKSLRACITKTIEAKPNHPFALRIESKANNGSRPTKFNYLFEVLRSYIHVLTWMKL